MFAKYVPMTRLAHANRIKKLARSGVSPCVIGRNSHITVVTTILVEEYRLYDFILVET